jgi:hypothetical protein
MDGFIQSDYESAKHSQRSDAPKRHHHDLAEGQFQPSNIPYANTNSQMNSGKALKNWNARSNAFSGMTGSSR